ncbi:MAG TPA: type II toxin-antitoxin system Phd/YefM family antitoxin [Herpetosiphonaceae bacterium]|nr:type II toxin-antitoxin system Phd/YefM family antitoxin [Herpetosiphonaceae bacterium]
MVKTMSTREARATLSDVLGSVYYTKEPVIVEKNGKPVAVIISPEDFRRLQEEDARDWAVIQAVGERHAEQDPDAVLADVTAEVEAVRREMYAERHAR